jgi:hypothetical protein
MAFGNIGKVIAGQALEAAKKNVIESVVGPEQPKTQDKPSVPVAPPVENIGPIILGQLQAMQRPLGDDRELVVTFQTGAESFRVLEIFVPNIHVFVLVGADAEHNVTRVVVPAESAVLVCKVMRVPPDARPVRVNVLSPRKPE